MKKLMTIFGAVLVASTIFTSCGTNPDDFKMENIKSTCDCVKMNSDLMKITNDLLEAETDKTKRKELIESDNFKEWTKKKMERLSYCSKNYSDKLEDVENCKESDSLFKELERDRKLHE